MIHFSSPNTSWRQRFIYSCFILTFTACPQEPETKGRSGASGAGKYVRYTQVHPVQSSTWLYHINLYCLSTRTRNDFTIRCIGCRKVRQGHSSTSGTIEYIRYNQVHSCIIFTFTAFPQTSKMKVRSGTSGAEKYVKYTQVHQVKSSKSGTIQYIRYTQVGQVQSGTIKHIRYNQVGQVQSSTSGTIK